MRILQIIHRNQLRGAEVFASQLSQHLTLRGHDIKLVAIHANQAKGKLPYPVVSLNRKGSSKWLDFYGWKKIAQIVQEFNPDVVQANAGDTLIYASLSKVLFRWEAPIVYRNASMMKAYLSGNISRFLYSYLFRQVNAVASVSSTTADDLASVYPFLRSKILIVPIGIDVDEFHDKNISKSSSQLNILHIGGFTFEKNHEGLLRIFKNILLFYPHAKLHLVGDGPLRQHISNLAKSFGLESNVIFHGSLAEPFGKFENVHALLLPSVIEGTPAVILEAFAAKVPVVAYDAGGVGEWLKSGETGYLVQRNNENAFAESLIRCLEADNSELLERARQFVGKRFDNRQITLRFEELYANVINN